MSLPEQPYSQDDIAFYLRHRFVYATAVGAGHAATRSATALAARYILHAPGWMQVFLMEYPGILRHGPRADLGLGGSTIGRYDPASGDASVVCTLPEGQVRATQAHEVGHKVSDNLYAFTGITFAEEGVWVDAFEAQLAAFREMPEGDRRTLTRSLHREAADLVDHLAHPCYQEDPARQGPEEAVAEMSLHFAELAHSLGERGAIARLMGVYPHLTVPFADAFMRDAKRHAADRLDHARAACAETVLQLNLTAGMAPEEPCAVFFRKAEVEALRVLYPTADVASIGGLVQSVGAVNLARSRHHLGLMRVERWFPQNGEARA